MPELSVHFKDLSWVHHCQKKSLSNLKVHIFKIHKFLNCNATHFWQTSRLKWADSSEFAPIRRYDVLQMTNNKLLPFQLSAVQNVVNISEAEDRVIIFTRSKLHWLPGSTPREWSQQNRKMWVNKFLDRNYSVCFDSRTIAAPVIKLTYFQ